MGLAVLKAFEVMWDIYKIISGVAKKSDLERAAKMMADMVIDLGVETFLAIVLKGAAKSRFRAAPNKAAGSADEVSSASGVVAKPKKKASTEPKKEKEAVVKPKIKRVPATKKDVEDVYKSYPWIDDPSKLKSHMDGTDFSKPIYKTTLPEGTQVIQYVRKNGRVGTHFAPKGTKMDALAINGDRILDVRAVKKQVTVIETTAAKFPMDVVPGVGGSGGGQQYIFGPDFADFLTGG